MYDDESLKMLLYISSFFHVSCLFESLVIMTLYNVLTFVTVNELCPFAFTPKPSSADHSFKLDR